MKSVYWTVCTVLSVHYWAALSFVKMHWCHVCHLLLQDWESLPNGTVRYNWPMSPHASQAFSIAHCTDPEDLPRIERSLHFQLDNVVLCSIRVFDSSVDCSSSLSLMQNMSYIITAQVLRWFLYWVALLLLQLFKAHMDYVERTKMSALSDRPADNNVYATPKRYHIKASTFYVERFKLVTASSLFIL